SLFVSPCEWHREGLGPIRILDLTVVGTPVIPGMSERPSMRPAEHKPAWPRQWRDAQRRHLLARRVAAVAAVQVPAISLNRQRRHISRAVSSGIADKAHPRRVPSRQLLGLLRREWSGHCQP